MIAVFTNISTSIVKGVRIIKALVMGKSDNREIKQVGPFGFDSNPTNDKRGLYVSTTTIGKYYSIGIINTQCKAEEGETRMFSTNTDGDTVKFNVWLKNDGTLLQGTKDTPGDYTNFATKFNELETAYNELKGKHNDLLDEYKLHTHSGVTSGPSATGTTVSTQTPSTGNIGAAKNEKIKYCD